MKMFNKVSKDLLVIALFSLIGLAVFVIYLSYFTTVMFAVAVAYLTYSLLKAAVTHKKNNKVIVAQV